MAPSAHVNAADNDDEEDGLEKSENEADDDACCPSSGA